MGNTNTTDNQAQSPITQNYEYINSVNKMAVLIGINYIGSKNELNGCINDTQNLKEFLIKNQYFLDSNMTFLNDKESKEELKPTKQNIFDQFDKLINFANQHLDENVLLFFSYSGHGTSVKDENNDEVDGYDEALCPVDYATNGFIIDDDIKAKFIDKLHSKVTLVVIIDACHSGTILDLKYNFSCNKKNTFTINSQEETKCTVIMISGCTDQQTSADAYIEDQESKQYEYEGAMTASFIANYTDEITTKILIQNMRKWLTQNQYTQTPQLSSGTFIDINKAFMLSAFNN